MQPRRRSRRAAAAATALVAALMMLVSACTSGPGASAPTSSSPVSPSPTSSSPSPVILRFAVYGGRDEIRAYRALARAYMRAKPGVTVRIEAVANATEERRNLDRQFAAGTAPDLFLTSSTALPALMAGDHVQPVDELLEQRGVQFGDNYERLGLEAMGADSALQCMPSDVSPLVVFYNKRLMNNATLSQSGSTQVPRPEQSGWTWDQFKAAATQMSTGRAKGLYLAPELTTLDPLLRSAGLSLVDDPAQPTTLTLSDPGSRDVVDEILAEARDPLTTFTPSQLRKQSALSRFEDGHLGMMLGTRAMVPELRRHQDLRFDAYPLPSLGRFQTVADVNGYCINKDSEQVPDAADFLTFATGTKGSAIVARSGAVVPANLAAQRTDSFVQADRFPLNINVFTRVIRRAETMPNPPAWSDVVRDTRPLLSRLFTGSAPNLDTLLPRIDAVSADLLAQPTPSASPGGD